MTRDDVIKLARDAGLGFAPPRSGQYGGGCIGGDIVSLHRFANLLLADFLERTGQYVTNDASREAVIAQAVAAEREACAKVAEGELGNTMVLTSYPTKSSAAWNIMQSIRARGAA